MRILILIWLLVWFWPGGGAPRDGDVALPLGPWTPHEKILFGYRLDVNRLSPKELEILPGIGPAAAQKIAAFRDQHGPFRAPEELDQIRGIGPQTVKNLTPWVSK